MLWGGMCTEGTGKTEDDNSLRRAPGKVPCDFEGGLGIDGLRLWLGLLVGLGQLSNASNTKRQIAPCHEKLTWQSLAPKPNLKPRAEPKPSLGTLIWGPQLLELGFVVNVQYLYKDYEGIRMLMMQDRAVAPESLDHQGGQRLNQMKTLLHLDPHSLLTYSLPFET